MIENQILQDKTATYHTLGCKLNFAETATISGMLEKEGVRQAEKGEKADICIINTCSVTDVADHKCRQTIHKLVRENPGAYVIVIGCYAQLQPEKISHIEGVDLVLGMEQKGQVVKYLRDRLLQKQSRKESEMKSCHEAIAVPTNEIRTFVPSCSSGERTRYFLKVQDGCDYYCTYCTIPLARGRSRNGTIESLVKQAEEVAAQGGKEIVITGVNIGDFGKSTGETFYDLIKHLDKVEGIERYRISSIEPNLLTDEILEFCAQSRAFMPHFHIPLQSGSDHVLKLMHRRYTTSFFASKISRIKKLIPDAFIGVDVIVGTRGETNEFFEEAYSFIETLPISQLHVFSYSERPDTKALNIEYTVPSEIKHERSQRLLALSEIKRKDFYTQAIGQRRFVLLEHSREGSSIRGFTDNYIRVQLPDTICLDNPDNQLLEVELGEFSVDESVLKGIIR